MCWHWKALLPRSILNKWLCWGKKDFTSFLSAQIWAKNLVHSSLPFEVRTSTESAQLFELEEAPYVSLKAQRAFPSFKSLYSPQPACLNAFFFILMFYFLKKSSFSYNHILLCIYPLPPFFLFLPKTIFFSSKLFRKCKAKKKMFSFFLEFWIKQVTCRFDQLSKLLMIFWFLSHPLASSKAGSAVSIHTGFSKNMCSSFFPPLFFAFETQRSQSPLTQVLFTSTAGVNLDDWKLYWTSRLRLTDGQSRYSPSAQRTAFRTQGETLNKCYSPFHIRWWLRGTTER